MANDPRSGGSRKGRAPQRRDPPRATDVQPGGPGAPAEVTIPGRREQEARTPGREATPDVGVPSPEPEREIPGHPHGEPSPEIPAPQRGDDRRARGASDPTPEEAPELLGERSDYPVVWGYGEDPGDVR